MYDICTFCKVMEGGERRKLIPFGLPLDEAQVLFVLPHFFDAREEEIRSLLTERYPEARFVGYIACQNVADFEAAKTLCAVLLRNESLKIKRFLFPKQLFEENQTRIVDGAVMGFYDGYSPLKPPAEAEYRRVLNAEV